MTVTLRNPGIKIFAIFAFALASLSGCAQTTQSFKTAPLEERRDDAIVSQAVVLAEKGVRMLEEEDFEGASRQFNKALKLDITNSSIQFLNGLAYHLRVLKGDVSYYPMAEKGYQLAAQFDRSNWLAHYYSGLIKQEQRNFSAAQDYFSEALLHRDNDPDILYALGASSYYAHDPETAAAAFKKFRELRPNDPRALKASAVVLAALGNADEANDLATRYGEVSKNDRKIAYLKGRLKSWGHLYQRVQGMPGTSNAGSGSVQQAQMSGMNDRSGNAEENSEEEEEEQEPDEYKMVIVDVVIIRTEEDIATSKGVNLLNGLWLQFGSTSLAEAAFSVARTSVKADDSPGFSKTITRALNIPSINYSLNIANSDTARNEILARPTLVALAGEESEFFSGVEVDAAAVGGANSEGSTVQIEKEIGVKLAIQPEFLEDGRVKLNVVAERTFLTTPNTSSITFDLRIDTSKTMVSANVVMNFGETLILSGLSEKETERARNGVPLLQDIPIVQYLFSNRTTRDFQKSVLILLTPRPPSYTYQSVSQRKSTRSRQNRSERTLSELQARYSDWFKPYPNWASVFHHMQDNTLYREFRTGDVTLERWANMETIKGRLKQALEFLYY